MTSDARNEICISRYILIIAERMGKDNTKMTEWAVKGIFKADAEKVDAEIKSIGEEVRPSDLVEYAKKHKRSELHKCFEWDDSAAAEKYRLEQAKTVIRMIVVVSEKPDVPPVREYSITTAKNTYAPTRTFLVKKDEYEALLQRALNELKAFKAKYKTLSELEAVFEAIDAI